MITHEENLDMPVALTAAGAIRADAHEFRLMNGGGDIDCPLGGIECPFGGGE